MSSNGTGGASAAEDVDLLAALLKAFRIEANEGFLVNDDFSVVEGCVECVKDELERLAANDVDGVWKENAESSDATEFPRE